jgi:hypothetical protein
MVFLLKTHFFADSHEDAFEEASQIAVSRELAESISLAGATNLLVHVVELCGKPQRSLLSAEYK